MMNPLIALTIRLKPRAGLLGAMIGLGLLMMPAAGLSAGSTPPALKPADNFHVSIPRAAFGKEYLLAASLIPQYQSPTSRGLAGRIVRFELFHDAVDLYESTAGLVVTDELPSRRLLTSFPIVAQDDTQVVIDFNAGMRRVIIQGWFAMGGFDPADLSRTLELPQSRVFEVQSEGSQLVLRQSAQMRSRETEANREERFEIRYFISPYETPEHKTKEHPASEERYVRFFVSQAQLEATTGRASAKIALFDIREPVTFYYSANTPGDYEQSMRDGILYWNRAFGKEVVKAEKAPPGVTAPDAKHNIVQWVPWDSAGSAYADALIDPRSGTTRHGQAYMTSVFAISGRARARALLRAMRTIAEEKGKKKEDSLTPSRPAEGWGTDFLPFASACEMDPVEFAEQFANGLEALLAVEGLDDRSILRASQDFVRHVVAHEVGHVLGLRHNFAGSLAATLSPKELNEWFEAYLKDPETDAMGDRITSSSVMEYSVFKASVFSGAKIRRTKEIDPYDKAAIRWGYFDDLTVKEKRLLMATDDDVPRYGDAQRFDYGVEPIVGAYAEIAEQIRNLPNSVIEVFIAAKAPRDPRDARPLAEVNLRVASYASPFVTQFDRILAWFRASTRSVRVENTFDFIGDLNKKEVLTAHWESLKGQIEKLGGLDRAAFSYLPANLKLELKDVSKDVTAADKLEAKKLGGRLAELLESPSYTTFVGLDEKTHQFTKEEKDLILERGKKLFAELETELIKRICQSLEKATRDIGLEATGSVGHDDVVAQLEKRVIDLAREVIMAKDDSSRRRGQVDKSYVEVVDFKHDQETRLAAARMLNDNIGTFKAWAADAKSDLNKQLKDSVEAALNIQHFKDFNESVLSRPLREWYQNQQAILALLPPRRPSAASSPPATEGPRPPPRQETSP